MQADTAVYKVLTESVGKSQPLITLAALVSGAGALAGAYLGSYLKSRGENLATKHDFETVLAQLSASTRTVEAAKYETDSRKALDGELRSAVHTLTTALARLFHSMCWLTWDAKARGRMSAERAKGYDTEAHVLLPEIAGQLALVASYDMEMHKRLEPIVSDAYSLDVAIGEAIVACERNPEQGLPLLIGKYAEAFQREADFRKKIAELVSERFRAKPHVT